MVKSKEPSPMVIQQEQLYQEMGLTDDEFAVIVSVLGRLPNYTETGLFSVMWSEHCSYKNSKPLLQTLPTDGPQVLQGPGEGAGIVDIGDGQAVVFKVESHNHPSAIEPYQGAATGVGGIIRDVFSMGARPVALLNSLRFGELTSPRTRYLFEHVVAGISGYGNCIGVPTVGGEVYFDSCYESNPLVNAMCVGLISHEAIQQGLASGVGNAVMYVGASTGRDGIHGATFASEELSEHSVEQRPAVQVGDPFMEKLLLEACLELVEKGLLLGIQDMGAAGLVSSSSEMASKAGTGIELDLDKIPQREDGMTAYEMMLSESQERMLLVVEQGREEAVGAVCSKWGLQWAVVGRVTKKKNLTLQHHGVTVADVPANSLAENAPVYHKPAKKPAWLGSLQSRSIDIAEDDCQKTFASLLAAPSIASKRWVFEQYDHMVRTDTVLLPGSDASVMRIRGTQKGLALTIDCNARYLYLDPFAGGANAVAEAFRNIVAVGARPLAITNCLNFGNPEKPESFWQLKEAVAGMAKACRQLNTPVISGNVSLYNESGDSAVYPTPVIGMVGLLDDLAFLLSTGFRQGGDVIILLGDTVSELGGSELQKLRCGKLYGRPPAVQLDKEAALYQLMQKLVKNKLLQSAHDLAEGGLAVAAAECGILGNFGFSLDVKTSLSPTACLFSETQARMLVSTRPDTVQTVIGLSRESGVPAYSIGQVTEDKVLEYVVNGQSVVAMELGVVKKLWEEAIPCLMNS